VRSFYFKGIVINPTPSLQQLWQSAAVEGAEFLSSRAIRQEHLHYDKVTLPAVLT
jgi:frataxin-like iron-binding protein CyaY